ncbi:MAG: P-loop NTPase [Solirubrobacterales bacterium]|nr:P-loop NTPase [Solirubrobacterales bacterium]
MKVVIAGKGGVGKTTIAGTLARALSRSGHDVLALDCDANPMLGISLGLGAERTEELVSAREGLESGDTPHQPTAAGMEETFGTDAPDGVRLVVAARVEQVEPGCMCCGVSPHQLLRDMEGESRMVVGDLEAGTGTLMRMPQGGANLALVITQPTAKAMQVARHALEAAKQRAIPAVLIANRVRTDADVELIRTTMGPQVGIPMAILAVPEDAAVAQADQDGLAPADVAPESPAVLAVQRLGQSVSEFAGAR